MTTQLKQPEFAKLQGSARTVFGKARQQDAFSRDYDARQSRGRLFKTCPECGTQNPGSAEFCEVDGVDLNNPVSIASPSKDAVFVEDVAHDNLEEFRPEVEVVDTDADESDSRLAAGVTSNGSVDVTEGSKTLSPERKKGTSARLGFLAMVVSLVGVSIWYFSNDSAPVIASPSQAPMIIDHGQKDQGQKNESLVSNVTETLPRLDQAALIQVAKVEEINPDMLALSIGNLKSNLAEESLPLSLNGEQAQAASVNTDDPKTEKSIDVADRDSAKELQQQLSIILSDSGFDGFNVIADADGVVTLKGVVSDLLTKQTVLVLVEQYDGVSRVRDKIFLIE